MRPNSGNSSLQKGAIKAATVKSVLGSIVVLLVALLASCAPAGSGASDAAGGATPTPAMRFSENSRLYEMVPQESEARFLIEEIFNGEEKTVVGATGEVSGQIAVDLADPATAAAGPIQVNANTLVTDNGFRDRAIRNRILLAGIYENVTFTPTAVNGLPETIELGEEVTFEIAGELTITNISERVTFQVRAVPVTESRLEGSATSRIKRSDFDLVVPSATGVAAVAEEVMLQLDFVAKSVD